MLRVQAQGQAPLLGGVSFAFPLYFQYSDNQTLYGEGSFLKECQAFSWHNNNKKTKTNLDATTAIKLYSSVGILCFSGDWLHNFKPLQRAFNHMSQHISTHTLNRNNFHERISKVSKLMSIEQ